MNEYKKGKYSKYEIETMIRMYSNNYNYVEIGSSINRSPRAVRDKLSVLGYKYKRKDSKHAYNVGEIVGNGTLLVITQTQIQYGGWNRKAYKVKSLKHPDDDNDYIMKEYDLLKGKSDLYLSRSQKIVCEEKSLYSYEHIRPYLLDIEQSKKTRPYSNIPIYFKCPDCPKVKKMQPAQLLNKGFSCSLCSKNLPYGQLAFGQYSEYFKLGFESEKRLPGLPNRRVDFINWENGMWIEIQGIQHTDKNSSRYESAHAQDLDKRAFNKSNDKYNLIEIDMCISSWEYFKEQINKCAHLPSINEYDENKILKLIERNKRYPIKEIINLYQNGVSTKDIASQYNISETTVLRRLKKHGVKIKTISDYKKGQSPSNKLDLPESKICKQYISGMTTYELADIYDCSPRTIGDLIKRKGVTLRNNSESQKLNIPIEEIIKMKNEGYFIKNIAKKFNCSETTIKNHIKKYSKS